MRPERGRNRAAVADIAFDERPPAHSVTVTTRQIVIGNRDIAGLGEGLAGMAADIAGAPCNQHGLGHFERSSPALKMPPQRNSEH
jgi:hypothetical protein